MSASVGASDCAAQVTSTRSHKHLQSRSHRAPPSDRGHEITSDRKPFQVHWFTGVTELPIDEVLDYVSGICGATLVPLSYGRQGYRSAYQAVELPGFMVLHEPGADNMPAVCVVVPGESCEVLGWDNLRELSAPFKPTRVDLAFDDFPFSPREVKKLVLNGYARTRAQRHTVKWHEDFAEIEDGIIGETVSLGSRGSNNFFRCYNSRGFDRGELELKGAMAVAAYELLQASISKARTMAIGFLRNFIDFVDPSTDTNKSRQAPLPRWLFWYRLVKKARVELPPRPVQTLDRLWTWFEKQLSPAVSLLASADISRLHESMHQAEQRWTMQQKGMLGAA